MNKLFENVGGNIFKLKEIDINRGQEEPENDPFKDVSKQIGQLRMNKPKGPELRMEKYKRIASELPNDDIRQMRDWIKSFTKDNDPEYEQHLGEIDKLEPWEVVEIIDNNYDDSGVDGIKKWISDRSSG